MDMDTPQDETPGRINADTPEETPNLTEGMSQAAEQQNDAMEVLVLNQ